MPFWGGVPMSVPLDHAAIEAAFQAALWVPETPPGLGPDATRERRFAVYRNNVQTGLVKALTSRFPVIERLVGAPFFAAMARVFAASHPPKTPVLLEWGGDFPGFLNGFPPVATLPYLPDVARLELARGVAYHAADVVPVDPAALAAIDPATVRLTLAPCVQLFASARGAVSIWQVNQPGQTPRPVKPAQEFALIARTPGFDVLVQPMKPATAALLGALMQGQTLAQAAEHADPTPVLTLLIQNGLITAISGDPA